MRRRLSSCPAILVAGLLVAACLPLPPSGDQYEAAALTAMGGAATDRAAVHQAVGQPRASYLDGGLEAFRLSGDTARMLMIVPLPGVPALVPMPVFTRVGAEDHLLFVAYDADGRVHGSLLWSARPGELPPAGRGTGSLAGLDRTRPEARLEPVVGWGEPPPPQSPRWRIYRSQPVDAAAGPIRGWPSVSPSGRLVALGGRPDLVVRDLATGLIAGRLAADGTVCGRLAQPEPGTGLLQSHQLFLDEMTVLVVDAARGLCRWQPTSGRAEPLGRAYDVGGPLWRMPSAALLHVALLDAGTIAFADRRGTIELYDTESGIGREHMAAPGGLNDCAAPIAVPDARLLLQSCIAGANRRTVVLRDGALLEVGRFATDAISSLPFLASFFAPELAGRLAFDAVNRRIALLQGPFVQLLELNAENTALRPALPILLSTALGLASRGSTDPRETSRLEPMPAVLTFSADGRRLAAGFIGCVVWDTTTWREIWRCDVESAALQAELDRGFAMTPNGRHIVTHDAVYQLPEGDGPS